NSTLGGIGAKGIAALGPLRPLRIVADVELVRAGASELTLVLKSGRELRLGDNGDLRLKLAIAKQLLPLTVGPRYLHLTLPAAPRRERARAAGWRIQPSSRRLRLRYIPCKSH